MALHGSRARARIESKERSLSTDTLDSYTMRKRVAVATSQGCVRGKRVQQATGKAGAEDESGGAEWRIGAARISIIRGRSGAQRRGRGVLHTRKSPSEMLISFSRAFRSLKVSEQGSGTESSLGNETDGKRKIMTLTRSP